MLEVLKDYGSSKISCKEVAHALGTIVLVAVVIQHSQVTC